MSNEEQFQEWLSEHKEELEDAVLDQFLGYHPGKMENPCTETSGTHPSNHENILRNYSGVFRVFSNLYFNTLDIMNQELELRIKMDVNYMKVALQILALGNDKIEVIVNNLSENEEMVIDLDSLAEPIGPISPEEMLQVKVLLTSIVAAQVAMNLEKKTDAVKP